MENPAGSDYKLFVLLSICIFKVIHLLLIWENVIYFKAVYATGQDDLQTISLSRQIVILAGHCPLTGRYFEPCGFLLPHPSPFNVPKENIGLYIWLPLSFRGMCVLFIVPSFRIWGDFTVKRVLSGPHITL